MEFVDEEKGGVFGGVVVDLVVELKTLVASTEMKEEEDEVEKLWWWLPWWR